MELELLCIFDGVYTNRQYQIYRTVDIKKEKLTLYKFHLNLTFKRMSKCFIVYLLITLYRF